MLCIEGQGMKPPAPDIVVGSAKMLHRLAQYNVDYL